jgi:dihydroflavonol-4-reductase
MKETTVLVTGGTGFVAGWCIVELLRQEYAVRTTVRDPSKAAALRATIATQIDAGDRLAIVAADLTSDSGWDAAVSGCEYVLHVASPLGGVESVDADALIAPARDGSMRVLRASARAGVKRVVMTSAAATARPPLSSNQISDETIWADPSDPQFDAYRRSKILAEQAAWEWMTANPTPMTLTTILPGAVFGPVLTKANLGSVRIIQRLLDGKPPALPRLGFSVVDVRDVAALHVRAMTMPQAGGERFLATGEFLWMEDIAKMLRSGLKERAAKVPTRRLPNALFRIVSLFAHDLRALTPLLGRRFASSSEKAARVLGFVPRPVAATIVDCGESLLP